MQRLLFSLYRSKPVLRSRPFSVSQSILHQEEELEEEAMSYRHRGGAGRGFGQPRGSRGPNRRGGRGRGGGGPPPGLSGREIGMFYARKSKQNKVEREKKSVRCYHACCILSEKSFYIVEVETISGPIFSLKTMVTAAILY